MVDMQGYIWKRMEKRFDTLEEKVDDLAIKLASEYATKSETDSARRWAIGAVVTTFIGLMGVLGAISL